MIDFQQAVITARDNIDSLVKGATNIQLEEALISEDKKLYEITFSYSVPNNDFTHMIDRNKNSHLRGLASILGSRKEYKVFLVDAKSGAFRGFRKYKGD